ncbi:MAG: hypothetical protein R2855_11975 [Thermomicrobiales bacterium]
MALPNLVSFAALGYLIVAGTTVVGALGQAASPRLAMIYATGDYRRFRRMMTAQLAALGFGVGLAGALIAAVLGSRILNCSIRRNMPDYTNVLLILTIAAGIEFRRVVRRLRHDGSAEFTVRV